MNDGDMEKVAENLFYRCFQSFVVMKEKNKKCFKDKRVTKRKSNILGNKKSKKKKIYSLLSFANTSTNDRH